MGYTDSRKAIKQGWQVWAESQKAYQNHKFINYKKK